jgi:hypothetical protein
MTKQGQHSAAPVEEAGFVDDVEGAGAAWGTQGAERAPIEFAAVGGTPVLSRA